MSTNDFAELVSLAGTASLLVVAVAAFRKYRPDLRRFFSESERPTTILRTGIAVGIVSTFIDNSYWSFPWGAKFLRHENAQALMDFGVFMNIPFRIFLTTLALWLHVKADAMRTGNRDEMRNLGIWMMAAFFLVGGVMYLLKVV